MIGQRASFDRQYGRFGNDNDCSYFQGLVPCENPYTKHANENQGHYALTSGGFSNLLIAGVDTDPRFILLRYFQTRVYPDAVSGTPGKEARNLFSAGLHHMGYASSCNSE